MTQALPQGKLYESQKLALWYFWVALALFGAQVLFGLLAAWQYLDPNFLHGKLNFMTNRMLHINAMVVWLLLGFMGGVYWFLPLELGREVVGIRLARFAFFTLIAAVGIVVLVYLLVQYGPGNAFTLWFITEGREYIEAPRWADIGIVAVMAIFLYNVVATALKAQRITGVVAVLMFDLVALAGLYTAGMHYTPNISMDQYFWWWVVHLWVEATWEVLVGSIMAMALMHLLGTPRRIVETWLYLEVALVFGTGILGLGHHYFWIGTPEYWLGLGGFFSALEPIPLVAMVVHAVYDAGMHRMQTVNQPALFWAIAQAFGNFIGAGVWGFMQTLPQINLYSHGTQLAPAHGHLAFFGAYVTAILTVIYMALHQVRRPELPRFDSKLWKWAFVLMVVSIFGMSAAMTIAGFTQTMVERAIGGSTWQAYIDAQQHPWFQSGMVWRFVFGVFFLISYLVLLWDVVTIGKGEAKVAKEVGAHD
ncbi:cbb3-type cytochrome c oxidase subunit I [Thermus sp. PS18]|uniref:cbb3-type cytochrome c oxidase subunit I n=1 Tax=Thermus sp. PS18 TaxID=2849039 RepID=UPI0022640C7B|nr:cbb3-type cytochrome c oxidase subunit I [Thermus sp. PS18]UZX15213.1 cbb3-type cytochrome c oxidase subunit I [Thermus sp. PS18]